MRGLHLSRSIYPIIDLWKKLSPRQTNKGIPKEWTCKFNIEQNDRTISQLKSPRDKITMMYVPNVQMRWWNILTVTVEKQQQIFGWDESQLPPYVPLALVGKCQRIFN